MRSGAVPGDIAVVITDDHDLVRAGLKALLATMSGVHVVGEARDGHELLAYLRSHPHPEVVLVDLEMPGLDGFDVLREMHQHYPQVRTLVLSMHDAASDIRRAMDSGASGYLPKNAPPDELEHALRAVVARGCYLSAEYARSLLLPPLGRAEDGLTPRQVQILSAVARGRTSKEIGYDLSLSSKTVDVHRCRIMHRLGINDIAGLTRYALRKGLVEAG
ncbi:response regulator transcription factor [Ramlibacter sp.]|uniref:response regulator n=1 Tax=Ramlibacter sp. TaxID=1917967 RepID=UPI00260DBED1|nr:response regulator transcription factor [Ramlibacter sp.]MDB5956479.1 putative response regulator, NarL [Ramlibacter sp.]